MLAIDHGEPAHVPRRRNPGAAQTQAQRRYARLCAYRLRRCHHLHRAMFTEDADIIVLVDTDEEHRDVFRKVGEAAQGMSGMHYVFDDVPIQLLPTTTLPLCRDTLDKARTTRIGSVPIKVATPEHLVIMCLEAFRPKDQVRILLLLPVSDAATIRSLLGEFDHDQGTLAKRLSSLRARGV